ncbi:MULTISPECIES: hypothetical protein [Dethiosulfovibrio]|jgi:hypothetical protein|uniref:DUF1641 domain-containing protein n=2 Tax=Dethiosulfovibrio TaxID=47054 RepID=A0ABS9ERF0_9BACT|nr:MULTISPECIES: hypothetical protein [Dethiosulfovibrio]MCF4114083.1 hypothetical protein [Dethiosulfovibrio russensis]MCF4142727.1 hypothetical protein [Dethiosulfovibrio marinus]MCF4144709.1 hypothetical protein [Dethiosulfovibrio acidaminovorans]
MRYEDTPPAVRVRKKESSCSAKEPPRLDSSLISQMSTATIAAVRSALRGLTDGDGAALAQAARNGHIVEELFMQENDLSQMESPERDLLDLAKRLSDVASLAVEASREDDVMKSVMDELPLYIETILDDLAPSPARCYLPSSGVRASRKRLSCIKEELVNSMARTSDPKTIRSGISIFKLIEHLEEAMPLAIKVGSALSKARKRI